MEYPEGTFYVDQNDMGYYLSIYNYNDLIIKGKHNIVEFLVDEYTDVFAISSCQNLVVENINFYHKVDEGCIQDVVHVHASNNILFNNVHFNGSGRIGCDIYNSNTIAFKNSHFFNNKESAIRSEGYSTNLSIVNSYFYNNSLTSDMIYVENEERNDHLGVSISNSIFTNNKINASVFNVFDTKLECFNTQIYNNKVSSFIYNYMSQLYFYNTNFTQNTGDLIGLVIDHNNSYYDEGKVFLKKSRITGNQNFYQLQEQSNDIEKDHSSQIDNIYSKVIDSVPLRINSTIINRKPYMNRYLYKLNKNDKGQVILESGYVLNGLQKIYSNNGKKFLGLDMSFLPKMQYIFKYGYGLCKQGEMEGLWRFTNNENEDFIADIYFKNGKANGEIKIYGFEDVVLLEGNYKNNKKQGNWRYYNQQGMLAKSMNYNDDLEKGPFIIYYPNGNIMEERSHKALDKGTISNYYTNGEKRSHLVFNDNGTVNLQKTKFYNKKKWYQKEGSEIDVVLAGAKFVVENGFNALQADLSGEKIKNKVVILENQVIEEDSEIRYHFLGYYKTNGEGLKHGISKILSFNNVDNTIQRATPNTSFFINYTNGKLYGTAYNYSQNLDLLFTLNPISVASINTKSYKGWFSALSEELNFIINAEGQFVLHGVYKKYYDHGKLKEKGMYKNDKKIEGTWKNFDP